MSQLTKEYIDQIIADIAKSCDLINWSYSVRNFEAKGQNYFGELIPVTLQGKKESKDVNLDLVLKLAPTDEQLRVSGAITRYFSKEMYVYTNVIRHYDKLQKELSLCNFVSPICFYVRNEYCKEVIALQDMRTSSYQPYLQPFLNLSHIEESLKSLAQFHALYFILKSRDKLKYEEITSHCPPLTENNSKRFISILIDRLQKALEKFKNTVHENLLRFLLNNHVELLESMATSVNATCLCHADIWKENILFKYEDKTPVSACLIDYQTARICSPAYDVLYIIATSTSTTLRHHNFNKLLDTYYETFNKIITKADLISKNVYSKEMFHSDLVKVGPGVVIVANTAIWLSCGLQQEGNVRSKIVLKTEEEKQEVVKQYMDNIRGILEDFIKFGYLDTTVKT